MARTIGRPISPSAQPTRRVLLAGLSLAALASVCARSPPSRPRARPAPWPAPQCSCASACWSKPKGRLRTEAARSPDALRADLGPALATVTAEDARSRFHLAGYPTPN